MSKVVDKSDFGPHGFRWLTLKRITYEDPRGRLRFWESAERLSRTGEVDGVAIITLVRSRTEPLKVILESQFRPSQGNLVIELPAGLIDEGETAAEAALRELKEETGYTGRVLDVSPICYSDPGMTNANMQFAVLEVDSDAPENASVNPEPEEGEFIDVFLLPYDGLYDALLAKQKESGWDIDARLLMYADAIRRTEQRMFAAADKPSSSEDITASSPRTEELDHSFPQLHVKTKRDVEANGVHDHAHVAMETAEKAAHSCKVGFIEEGSSPAVLKTEFPAKLEPVTHEQPRTAFDNADGEILLENETPPGQNGIPRTDSGNGGFEFDSSRPSLDGGRRRAEGRSSVDLAAGLARSPKSPGVPAPESDADLDYANGLFPRFRGTNSGAGVSASERALEGQSSLAEIDDRVASNTVHHVDETQHSREDVDGSKQNGGDISSKADKEVVPGKVTFTANSLGGKIAGSLESLEGRLTFASGVLFGGLAGALLTYMSSCHRR